MRVLLILLFALGYMSRPTGLLAEEPSLPTDLTAAIGQEQILGFDYLSDVIPSTSDCLGNNLTITCAIDTRMACRYWNEPHACALVGTVDRTRDRYFLVPEYSSEAYYRTRYEIVEVRRLDNSLTLPWLDPAARSSSLSRYQRLAWDLASPRSGDIAVTLRTRECRPGGEVCVATMEEPLDVSRDICVRVDPCYGDEAFFGQIWRQTAQGWTLVQTWNLTDLFSR